MISENYNSKNNRIETTLEGSISIDDILTHYSFIRKSSEFPRSLDVLIDARNATLTIEVEDIRRIEKTINITKLKYDNIREAIVVSKPYDVAMATLSSMISKGNFEFQPFTSIEAALKWL